MLLELHPEALEELEAAVDWHNRERADCQLHFT